MIFEALLHECNIRIYGALNVGYFLWEIYCYAIIFVVEWLFDVEIWIVKEIHLNLVFLLFFLFTRDVHFIVCTFESYQNFCFSYTDVKFYKDITCLLLLHVHIQL